MKNYLFGLMLISVIGCSKGNDQNNTVVPPLTKDSLAPGWSYESLSKPFTASDVYFTKDTGFAVGYTWICRSTDGGKTWDSLYHNGINSNFISIGMGDGNHAIFVEEAPGTNSSTDIRRTDNGGATLTKVTIQDGDISNVFFVSPSVVFAVGQKCWKSVDAGNTWTPLFDFGTAAITDYRGLFFIDAQTGWTTAPNGLYKTTNGGTSWQLVSPFGLSVSELFFTDAANGYVTDNTLISKTTNGGANWNSLRDLSQGYHDVHFVSANVGYVSDKKKLYKTTDGGITWKTEVDLVSSNIGEIHFTDASHGWACVDLAGSILRYKQ